MSLYPKVRGYPKANCVEEWNLHRKWRLLSIISPFALFGLAIVIFAGFGKELGKIAGYVVSLVLAVLYILANTKAASFKCPRCGFDFYPMRYAGFGYKILARKCQNCGLKKWECDSHPTS